jgi:uncharacterized protein (DUF924 family)
MQLDPEDVLAFWFGDAADDVAKATARVPFWFEPSPETDARVRERFGAALEAASRGALPAWPDGPRASLARVVLLDQLPRNVWRGTARAFSLDPQALAAAEAAVAAGHLARLAPIEQGFLVLPYQHSESLDRQRDSVRLSNEITNAAPPAWRPLLAEFQLYAEQHLALIERFGRFPHRNAVLGRAPTPEEVAFLRGGGATYGQDAAG